MQCNLHFVAATNNVIEDWIVPDPGLILSSWPCFPHRSSDIQTTGRKSQWIARAVDDRRQASISLSSLTARAGEILYTVQPDWRARTNATAKLNESDCCKDHSDLRSWV